MLNLADTGRILTAGRQKGQELSPTARAAVCGAVAAGASQRAVATAFGVSRSVIQDTIQSSTTSVSFDSKLRCGRGEGGIIPTQRFISRS